MKKARYLVEALLLRLIMFVSGLLPPQQASALGGFLGRMIGPRLSASRKAHRNIQTVLPDKGGQNHRKIVKGMWDNLGRVMFEYPHLEIIAKERTAIIGTQHLKNLDKDKPLLVLSGHLGNWEICPPAFYHQHDFITHTVYRAPNNPLSDKLLLNARQKNNPLGFIPKGHEGTRTLVKFFKNKEMIGMLIDQKYNEGPSVNFMGYPARTATAFAELGHRFGAQMMPIHVERLPDCRFRLQIEPLQDMATRAPEEWVAIMHTYLDGWIRKNPQQWLWLHRRWRFSEIKTKTENQ